MGDTEARRCPGAGSVQQARTAQRQREENHSLAQTAPG